MLSIDFDDWWLAFILMLMCDCECIFIFYVLTKHEAHKAYKLFSSAFMTQAIYGNFLYIWRLHYIWKQALRQLSSNLSIWAIYGKFRECSLNGKSRSYIYIDIWNSCLYMESSKEIYGSFWRDWSSSLYGVAIYVTWWYGIVNVAFWWHGSYVEHT